MNLLITYLRRRWHRGTNRRRCTPYLASSITHFNTRPTWLERGDYELR
jgi:hypothetical protein